jgi:hypothetical protein
LEENFTLVAVAVEPLGIMLETLADLVELAVVAVEATALGISMVMEALEVSVLEETVKLALAET